MSPAHPRCVSHRVSLPAHLRVDCSDPATGLALWQATVVLGVLCGALHAWRIHWPLSTEDLNLGNYFGPAARTWQALGFWELHGAPCWLYRPTDPNACIPYLNHPPGLYWLMFWLGGDEWALRLPGIVGSWLASVALYVLSAERLGKTNALVAATLLLCCPGISVIAIGSYEPVVLAAGLWLWRLTDAGRSAIPAAAVAFLGAWVDWPFAFFVAGLVFLRPWRQLVLPWATAVVGAATAFGWREWALARPFPALPTESTGWDLAMANGVVGRPGAVEWLTAAGRLLPATFGWAVCVLAILGLPIVLTRWPKFALACLCAGLTPLVVFANHALDHIIFYTLIGPLVVTCAVAPIVFIQRRWNGRIGTAIAALACVLTCASSLLRIESADHDLPRAVGRALSNAARAGEGRVTVATNYPRTLLYYVDHQNALASHRLSAQQIDALRKTAFAVDGLRFLQDRSQGNASLEHYLESESSGEPEPLLGPDQERLQWWALPPP